MKWKHNFKELQKKSGYSIKEIAKHTGISEDVLYGMSRNPYYNPTLDTIGRLCKFLNCTPGDLIEVPVDSDNSSSPNSTSVEKTAIKVNNLESIVEYVRRLPAKEREMVEGIYKRVLETVVMAMEK